MSCHSTGKYVAAELFIELPISSSETRETTCQCGITTKSDGIERTLNVFGVDEIQTVYLAMRMLDTMLDDLRGEFKLTWLDGGEMDNLTVSA